MKSVDYKAKYLKLRNQMVKNMKRSYTMGYTDGAKEKELEMMMMEQQQQQAEMEAMMNQPQVDENGMPIEGEMPPEEGIDPAMTQGMDDAMLSQDTEFDMLVGELEDIVAKSEKGGEALQKIEKLKRTKNTLKKTMQLKAMSNPTALGKSLRKDRFLKGNAIKNLSKGQVKALTMQKNLVEESMSNFKKGGNKAASDIISALIKSEETHEAEHQKAEAAQAVIRESLEKTRAAKKGK